MSRTVCRSGHLFESIARIDPNPTTVRQNRILFLLMLVGVLLLGLNDSLADEQKKNYSVSQTTYRVLEKSRKLSDESRYREAETLLSQQLPETASNRYETALIHQHLAYIYLQQQNYRRAAKSLEAALAGGDTLPETTTHDLRYNLAQVYMQTEQYAKVPPIIEQWFANEPKPGADAWYLKALAYYKLDRYAAAVAPLQKALALEPHEDWYVLLLSVHLQQKHYRQAVPVLTRLVDLYPGKKEYWLQLTDVHLLLKDYRKALATLKLADHSVVLEEKDILRLAQLYLHNNIPFSAARVLLASLEQHKIKHNAANLELLANSWAMAREHQKELKYLHQAAKLNNDGRLYQRCGQILLQMERWDEAITALKQALAKGNLKQPQQSYLLIGIAAYNANHLKTADWAFSQAQKSKQTRQQAERWLQQLQQKKQVSTQS